MIPALRTISALFGAALYLCKLVTLLLLFLLTLFLNTLRNLDPTGLNGAKWERNIPVPKEVACINKTMSPKKNSGARVP